jgi:hypothetical protein
MSTADEMIDCYKEDQQLQSTTSLSNSSKSIKRYNGLSRN